MARSNSAVWFNEPNTRVGILTIKDRRARVREQEDLEDIKQAIKETNEQNSVRPQSMQA